MKRLLSCLVVIAAVAVLLANSFGPQGPKQVVLRDGPYKVVVSKPLESRGWKIGSIYSEHEHLTELFNQLAIDGLTPLFSQVTTERSQGQLAQDRLLVVCRRP